MFSIFNGIYDGYVRIIVRKEHLLNEVSINGSYELPLGGAYIRGHYLIVLYGVQFIDAINHVSKAVDEVEQNPH